MQLKPSISIKIWDGDLGCIQNFAFDFVNGRGQHVRTPKDIKFYSMLAPHAQLPFMEQSEWAEAALLALAHSFPNSPFIIDQNNDDPNWQTHIVQEGIVLRIRQRNHEDRISLYPHESQSAPPLWCSSLGEGSGLRMGVLQMGSHFVEDEEHCMAQFVLT